MLNLSLISIGFLFICVSLFIKLSIAPFHYWSLDVYEGSPNTTTFFFAVVPKISLFVLLMRLCYVSFYPIFMTDFQIYFFILAVLSIFVGSLGGLEQRKLKTLLAYSSVSHTGYLLLAFSTGNVEGVQMMFYYLVIYMISGLSFWSVYLFLIQKQSTYFNKNNKELSDLILLKESNPILALILAMTLFSIAGIPPIVGFLAKVGVFLVVVKSSAYLVSVVSIVLSVISTFYYIRLIKVLYFENTLVGKLYLPITTQKSLVIAILSFSLIILCIDPMLIYLLFYKAILLAN
jgi:NADH-quinone oxidoreductase subunit N